MSIIPAGRLTAGQINTLEERLRKRERALTAPAIAAIKAAGRPWEDYGTPFFSQMEANRDLPEVAAYLSTEADLSALRSACRAAWGPGFLPSAYPRGFAVTVRPLPRPVS